ncbi:uncharacterized protein LOC103312277 isoform X2 [Tribolium castaneum]|nr:PREDICTED: uncharacterized protein LOC103312277 isoform X2 [Tribolium castaneum]|eukprot:XP_008190743.1 PREDICTED: uncharacterized protein LOC103312277 isoform X2 [Tribolium castaneum]
METFGVSGTPQKFRTGNFHNVPCHRNLRQIGNDYAMPVCNRRSTPSVHTLWQERMSPRSCTERKSRGRLCSVALAIASFLVFVAVLSIAGMALYMGALHTEPPSSNNIISFSCSAKILRGDRFTGALQEKARRYRLQLETLYQRSVLGPALTSCIVEKFGNDTVTVFFKLAFNKKKISKNVSNLEKTIRDILITDAISRKPVFRMIRFDPKSIEIKQIRDVDTYQRSATKPKDTKNKTSVVLKTPRKNTTLTTTLPVKKKTDEIEIKEEDLPVVQGSFKISKTDADITEKKTENVSTPKPKITTQATKTTTIKETSVTSALYKIAAIEKLSKTSTGTPSTSTTTKNPLFSNPQVFNEQPWIPIIPDLTPITVPTTKPPQIPPKQPIYTSFTNPSLSYHNIDMEPLGSTSLKGHPIPVNKIPQVTEPSVFETSKKPTENSGFVEIETVKYVPGSSGDKMKQQNMLKNLSSIFHDLASTLKIPEMNVSKNETFLGVADEDSVGEGQVEVVEADEETLMMQTTKLPLVTLIPVKSNSGIGRPLRKRPFRNEENSTGDVSVENRSFPGSTRLNDFSALEKNPLKFIETEVVTSVSSEVNKVKLNKNQLEDFKIVGVLNFATEASDTSEELLRNPKMDPQSNRTEVLRKHEPSSEITVYATNSSVSSNRKEANFNILTPEKLKQLSEISKIHDNLTVIDKEPVISNKAISSSYTVNHSGFKILTKTFNKIDELPKDTKLNGYNNLAFTAISNKTECGNLTIKCGDGQCLPETTKCNQLIDCNDGKDEQDCNCADYLRSQYLLRKICDGVVDCWDYSDENQCEWCEPQQYVCSNSKMCIDKTKICDGLRDCPQGDDERQCVTIAENIDAADEFPYTSEGLLMVRKFGSWGKLCVENLRNLVFPILDLGKAVCKSMTYQFLDSVKSVTETDERTPSRYFEMDYTFENSSKYSLSFSETGCETRKVVRVRCQALECGARPQAVKHIARIVGGGNAGLGSWPWQAALYKEGEFQCGATLLSDTWLVSAGHCFYHSQDEHWVARLGALRRGTALPSPYEQLRPITRIIVHPGYVDSGFINDISLLKMEFPVIFSDYVRPICLPPPGQMVPDGRLCTVVGWGQLFEVGRIFPDTLQEVLVPVISTAECRKRTVFLPLYKITDDMFCAGYERGGRDACLGDSGGPLMCPEPDGKWLLQGITSNGYGCARANRPGVYTKVANYVTWIEAHMSRDDHNSTKKKSVCLGHRCPLGECLPKSRLCNGYIECSDGSDERDC